MLVFDFAYSSFSHNITVVAVYSVHCTLLKVAMKEVTLENLKNTSQYTLHSTATMPLTPYHLILFSVFF